MKGVYCVSIKMSGSPAPVLKFMEATPVTIALENWGQKKIAKVLHQYFGEL